MRKRDVKVFLEDILESIEKIEEYVRSVDEQDFYENTLVQDAVLRRLEIIGEAAKNIPRSVRERYSGHSLEGDGRNERCSHTRLLWR